MTLWFVFALMTAAAIFAVLWPLGRGGRPQGEGSEAAVYKDQLAEIDRDAAAGLIGVAEAEAARVEISRRLLAAADSETGLPAASNTRLRRSAAVIALVGLPIVAVGVLSCRWDRRGSAIFRSPQRSRAPDVAQPLDNLVAQVEAHLEKNPTDGRGWNVLAPVLARLGRYDDAVRAYRNSITYSGDSSERRADLGEALAAAAGGVVTAEAKAEFERAVALNADEVKASYFLGLAAEQDGRAQRGRLDLARDAGEGAAGCAVASAGAGGAGAGRRPVRAGAVGRNDGRGKGHERGRPRRHDPRHGRAARHATEAKRRRRRRMAAAGAGLYGDGRSRQGEGRACRCPSGRRQRRRAAAGN